LTQGQGCKYHPAPGGATSNLAVSPSSLLEKKNNNQHVRCREKIMTCVQQTGGEEIQKQKQKQKQQQKSTRGK